MKCPYCDFPESRVLDSRPSEDGNSIRRRRACNQCNRRFTTYERVEMIPVMVIKKDSRREALNPEKIRMSIFRACEKRKLSGEQIDRMVDRVLKNIYASGENEVGSDHIGKYVMEELKQADLVAYVRFASVYLQFSDIDDIYRELGKLTQETKKIEKPQ